MPADPVTPDPVTPEPMEPEAGSSAAAWRRLARMGRPRPTKANVLVSLLAIALGFALATQLKLSREDGLERLRQDELIKLLDQVSSRATDLDSQVRTLQSQRDAIAGGRTSREDDLRRAQARLDTLGLLAGTVAATGPGIVVTISDPGAKVTPAAVLDALEELRDAGAEVIDIGGVRVVVETAVTGEAGRIQVGGVAVPYPIVITAIGDPATMATAMNIPGGVVANVDQLGGSATVRQETRLRVTSLHGQNSPRYARPVTTVPPSAPATTPSSR